MKLLCLDTETDGVDVHNDHIITVFVGLMNENGHWDAQKHLLLRPTRPIPQGASDVHGITTEHAQAHGQAPEAALAAIHSIVRREAIDNGVPLVIYNAPFDTTLLNAEITRYGGPALPFWDPTLIRILDPLVIDKHLYQFRKGKGSRRLTNVAPIYHVPVETNAHDAGADCLMAGRVALKQLAILRPRAHSIDDLQGLQKKWHHEQATSLEAYFKKQGTLESPVNKDWPIQAPPERAAA